MSVCASVKREITNIIEMMITDLPEERPQLSDYSLSHAGGPFYHPTHYYIIALMGNTLWSGYNIIYHIPYPYCSHPLPY